MLWSSAVPAFFASLVEFVEALTIVLAVGVSVNWKSSLTGAAAAAGVLAVLVTGFGAALIQFVPLEILRLAVGVVLIAFGLQWLKKALLRYGGVKARRDEGALFERQKRWAEGQRGKRFNPFGFFASFKSVLLEGLEVAFIVLSFGASAPGTAGLWSAGAGALAALALVVVLGILIRGPLTRVPENSLKFVVGWLLVTFGVFWAGEGLGFEWPGSDGFLLILGTVLLAECGLLTMYLKAKAARGAAEPPEAERASGLLRVLQELFDFFCGDWWIAGGVAVSVAAACWLPFSGWALLAGTALTLILSAGRAAVKTKTPGSSE